jgi:CRISPR-associated protein (TIGR03984 family)
MSHPRILYGRSTEEIKLLDALNCCSKYFSNGAVGIFYSPAACQFGQFQNGLVSGENGAELDLKNVFEARIFNTQGEFRWLNHSSGFGKAVLLSQEDIKNYFEKDLEPIEAIDIIDSQYLLWGEGTGNQEINKGWSYLSAARIGKFAVPIQGIDSNQRVKLKFREYLGVWNTADPQDNHGNVVVLEERLLGLDKSEESKS